MLLNTRFRKVAVQHLVIRTRAMSSALPEVIMEQIGKIGVITLNRPKALNALNLQMAKEIHQTLKQWETQAQFVIIKGTGEKAFCAGGDIRAVTEAGKKKDPSAQLFFRSEYELNYLIGVLKIPYVALIHGITMGGGVGLSVHGKYRVASEKSLFAMPETAIGLFPDVGASHFLPRLNGNLGTYLGLTGFRLKGSDLLRVGIATHFCDFDKLPTLESELLKLKNPAELPNVLNRFTEQSQNQQKDFILDPHLDKINQCFGFNSVEEILNKLKSDGSSWSQEQCDTLARMSPTSLKISLKLIREGKRKANLKESLQMEYRLVVRVLQGHDFYEGVRAVLVDKDNKPNWKPSRLEDVTNERVESFFAPLPKEEELVLENVPKANM